MQEAVISGIVLSDGTLQLNQPVPLPPGNVEVLIRPRPAPGPGILETLQRIWSESKRANFVPRSAEEIDADIESIREAANQEIGELGEIAQPDKHGRGP
jgi:hypothetical protein